MAIIYGHISISSAPIISVVPTLFVVSSVSVASTSTISTKATMDIGGAVSISATSTVSSSSTMNISGAISIFALSVVLASATNIYGAVSISSASSMSCSFPRWSMILDVPQTADVYDFEHIYSDETNGVDILTGVFSHDRYQPFEAKYQFANISIATEVDILTTDSPIQNGDTLVLVKADNTIVKVTASGVTGSGPYLMPASIGEIPLRAYTVDAKVTFDISGDYVDAVAIEPIVYDSTPGDDPAPITYRFTASTGNYVDESYTFGPYPGDVSVTLSGSTESNYDYIYLYDKDNNQITRQDGTLSGTYVRDSQIRVRYVSDLSVNRGPAYADFTYQPPALPSIFEATVLYENLIDPVGSTIISPKVTLKSIGDKVIEVTGTIGEFQKINIEATSSVLAAARIIYSGSALILSLSSSTMVPSKIANGSALVLSQSTLGIVDSLLAGNSVFITHSSDILVEGGIYIRGFVPLVSTSTLSSSSSIIRSGSIFMTPSSTAVSDSLITERIFGVGEWVLTSITRSGLAVVVETDVLIDFSATECKFFENFNDVNSHGVILHDPVNLNFVNRGYPNEVDCEPHEGNDYTDLIFPFSRDVSISILRNNRSIVGSGSRKIRTVRGPNVFRVNTVYDDTNMQTEFLS